MGMIPIRNNFAARRSGITSPFRICSESGRAMLTILEPSSAFRGVGVQAVKESDGFPHCNRLYEWRGKVFLIQFDSVTAADEWAERTRFALGWAAAGQLIQLWPTKEAE